MVNCQECTVGWGKKRVFNPVLPREQLHAPTTGEGEGERNAAEFAAATMSGTEGNQEVIREVMSAAADSDPATLGENAGPARGPGIATAAANYRRSH